MDADYSVIINQAYSFTVHLFYHTVLKTTILFQANSRLISSAICATTSELLILSSML